MKAYENEICQVALTSWWRRSLSSWSCWFTCARPLYCTGKWWAHLSEVTTLYTHGIFRQTGPSFGGRDRPLQMTLSVAQAQEVRHMMITFDVLTSCLIWSSPRFCITSSVAIPSILITVLPYRPKITTIISTTSTNNNNNDIIITIIMYHHHQCYHYHLHNRHI